MVWEEIKISFFPLRKKKCLYELQVVGKMSKRDIQLFWEELGKQNKGAHTAFSAALQCSCIRQERLEKAHRRQDWSGFSPGHSCQTVLVLYSGLEKAIEVLFTLGVGWEKVWDFHLGHRGLGKVSEALLEQTEKGNGFQGAAPPRSQPDFWGGLSVLVSLADV